MMSVSLGVCMLIMFYIGLLRFGCMYSCGSLALNFTIIYVGLISIASKLCEWLVWGFCSSVQWAFCFWFVSFLGGLLSYMNSLNFS